MNLQGFTGICDPQMTCQGCKVSSNHTRTRGHLCPPVKTHEFPPAAPASGSGLSAHLVPRPQHTPDTHTHGHLTRAGSPASQRTHHHLAGAAGPSSLTRELAWPADAFLPPTWWQLPKAALPVLFRAVCVPLPVLVSVSRFSARLRWLPLEACW